MRAPLLPLAVAAATLGCGPSLLWHARSDDRRYEVRVETHEGGERVIEDGRAHARFDRVLVSHLVLPPSGVAYVAQRSGAFFLVSSGGAFGPFEEVGEPLAVGEHVVSPVREAGRVRLGLLRGERFRSVGPELDGILPGSLALAPTGRVAFVGLLGGAQRLVWGDVARDEITFGMSEPVEAVRHVTLTDAGVVAVLREGGTERVVLALGTDAPPTTLTAGWEEVLEPNVCSNGGLAFLGARAADVVVVHRPPEAAAAAVRVVLAAEIITHLRISDDGAHVAFLVPDPSGERISLFRDESVVATHRRIDGERLAFVPASSALAWVAEDSQAPRVFVDGVASERYAEIEGPVLASGRVGFIGRGAVGREWQSDVVFFSVGAAEMQVEESAPWAGMLWLAGHGYVYVTRRGGERRVATSHGHWPVPRFFVDTLVLDPTGDHWAALVPDASEREVSVWIDGQARVRLDLDEVGARIAASGGRLDAPDVLVALARAELEAYLE